MRKHRWCLALGVLVAFATETHAFTGSWSNGSADLKFQSARRCTLLIGTSVAGEVLPAEWRLSWVAEASADVPMRLVAQDGGGDIAQVCNLFSGLSAADVASYLQTATFCASASAPRATVAAYVLDVASGVHGKIHVTPVAWPVSQPGSGVPGPAIEVTLNGGSSLPYPPVLLHGQIWRSGDAVVIAARGADLENVGSLAYIPRGELGRFSFSISSKTDSVLLARATIAGPLPPGRLEATTALGQAGSVAMSGEPNLPAAPPPGDAFVLRFHPHALDSANVTGPTPISRFEFNSAALKQSLIAVGVTTLEPIFPWFRHSDVHSRNFIGEPIELEDLADYYRAYVAQGTDISVAVKTAGGSEGVLYAGLDYGGVAALAPPNDPFYQDGKQWTLKNTGQVLCGLTASSGTDLQGEFSWSKTTGSPSVRVAILDTGIDTTHQELASPPRVRAGPPFVQPAVGTSIDDEAGFHGTAIAGIIAAAGNNGVGMAGMAWGVVPWAVKVLRGSDDFSRASWVAQGISWATANQFPILNMSLGFPQQLCPIFPNALPIPPDSANIMAAACLNAFNSGAFLVAGMGNCDANLPYWPAAFTRRVYAVGAMFLDGQRWEDYNFASAQCGTPENCPGSSWGDWIDALAPGGRLVVTLAQGPSTYNDILPNCNAPARFGMSFGGTSASAAMTSGTAALMKSYNSNLMGEDIEQLLNITALHLAAPPNFYWNNLVGYGLLRPGLALGQTAPPWLLLHGTLGNQGSFGALADVDSVQLIRTFKNVPGLPLKPSNPNQIYTCWRHTMRGTAQFNAGFAPPPAGRPLLWVRSSGSFGWRDTTIFDYNVEVNTDSIVNWDATSGTFQTYVYHIIDPANPTQFLGWFPKPPYGAVVAFTANGVSGLADVSLPSSGTFLSISSFPNPAAGKVYLNLALPFRGWLRSAVLDVSGRTIARLADGEFAEGTQRLEWDGHSDRGARCPAGIYFCQIEFAGRSAVRRFVLLGGR